MRQIIVNLYKFNELSEKARNNAIGKLKDEVYQAKSEMDWDEANFTSHKVKEIAQVSCDIRESSQGRYVWWAENKTNGELSDERQFEQTIRELKNMRTDTWADEELKAIVDKYKYNERRDYAYNVALMLIQFYDRIDDICYQYHDGNFVQEYAIVNDLEFTEDGDLY